MATTPRKTDKADDPRKGRRQEILDAAFSEFSSKGFDGASMESIARQAQASKETLYAWFGNKEKLFDTLLHNRIEAFTAPYQPGTFGADSPPDKVLEAIAADVMRFMLAVEPLSRSMGAMNENAAKARRSAGRLVATERKKFAATVVRWRSQGLITFDDDPNELVSLFIAMAQGEWSFRLSTGMIDRLTDDMIQAHARRVTRMFLKGLAPQKRRG